MTLIVTSSSVNEQGLNETIRGQYGTMYLSTNGSSLEYKPERPFAEVDPESYTNLEPSGNTTPQHHKNWLDCIRSGEEPVAGIDLAMKVQAVISLAEVADRRGTMAHFDPKTRKITDGSGRDQGLRLRRGSQDRPWPIRTDQGNRRLSQPTGSTGNRGAFFYPMPETVTVAAEAMATRFEVALVWRGRGHSARGGRRGSGGNHPAGKHAQPLSTHQRNRPYQHRGAQEPVPVSPEVFRSWSSALRLANKPVELDITLAPLMRCWRFMNDTGAALRNRSRQGPGPLWLATALA